MRHLLSLLLTVCIAWPTNFIPQAFASDQPDAPCDQANLYLQSRQPGNEYIIIKNNFGLVIKISPVTATNSNANNW